jgi:hypothetical protein
VYALVGVDNERLSVYTWAGDGSLESTALHEWSRLPDDLRIPPGSRRQMVVLNGVVFIGGFFDDPQGNEDQAALLWATDQGNGLVGRIRERGTNEQIRALHTTIDNQVLFGTNKGKVYAYNMSTGGFYEFASGLAATDLVQSFCYDAGQYFVATLASGAGEIFATLKSGTGKHPASVKVEGSRWNFDAREKKMLLSVSVEGVFPSDTSADLSFITDDGSEITTDAAGATMTASTTGTTTFTISSASVERAFRWLQPIITLKTSDTSKTPIVQAVRARATTMTKEKYLLCRVALGGRTPKRHVTASKAGAELEALADSDSNHIVTIKPYWEKAPPPHVRATDTYSCIIDDAIQEIPAQGTGVATLRMRVI